MQELSGFITDLLLDKNGWLWIATDGAGIIRLKETEIFNQGEVLRSFDQYTINSPLSDDYVQSLYQAESGDIWLGYWDKGLDRYDPVQNAFHHYLVTDDLSVNFQKFPIIHLIETREANQNFLWLGTTWWRGL